MGATRGTISRQWRLFTALLTELIFVVLFTQQNRYKLNSPMRVPPRGPLRFGTDKYS